MKILVICTACIKDRDIQYDLYDYWANTGGNDVMVIAPQQADVTKGGTMALREEKVGRLDIRRLYRDIPEMWNQQEKALEELVPLVQRFRPEVIWCWHENNYPLAACLAKLFTPTVPVVPYLEIP
ncbi:MAG TPA: hypothetical protein VLL73_00320, partial [Desulfurivibrionaceae bacterium]|nr:hypothetical protein [Desulfurivibrionaceae bacterium]